MSSVFCIYLWINNIDMNPYAAFKMKNENRMKMIETWDQKIVMQWASVYKRLSEENYDSGKAAVGGGRTLS